MVFRRDNKTDSFQRQMSALRQQIGSDETAEARPEPRYPSERAAAYSEPTTGAYGFGEFASAVAPTQTGANQMTPVAPELPAIPTVDAQTTVIAHDTVWKGEIQSNGTVHVHGRLEGAVRATRDVYVAEEADVDATVTATNVVIAGLVKGTIRCEARFEVLPSGRVSGDILAPTLVIHEGATVSGQVRMGGQETVEAKPTPVVQRRATRGTA
ncbi:MAG: polymer-forming cytoskeletal protein [Thermomicrobiales bacterium]|nr:polymer-forming cytoskeletal protein [Thermomicrobiales bacterium]